MGEKQKNISKCESPDLEFFHVAFPCYSTDFIESQIKSISTIFDFSYSTYLRDEWDLYGVHPPETNNVYRAWRHIEKKSFTFLIEDHNYKKNSYTIFMVLYIIAEPKELNNLKQKISKIKNEITKEERRAKKNINNEKIWIKETGIENLKRITRVAGVPALVTKGISFLIEKFSTNNVPSNGLGIIYHQSTIIFHILANFLIILFLAFFIFFYLYILWAYIVSRIKRNLHL